MALYNSDINALYIHIPKAYGSSIAQVLMKMGFKQIIKENMMSKNIGVLQYIENNKSQYVNKDTFIFTFIRNPIDRFISGCNYCNVDINEIFNKKISLCQYWHIAMPQINHLVVKDEYNYNIGLLKSKYNIHFIGKCEEIDKDWDELLKLLGERGLKSLSPFNILKNKSLKYKNNCKELLKLDTKNNIYNKFSNDFYLFCN